MNWCCCNRAETPLDQLQMIFQEWSWATVESCSCCTTAETPQDQATNAVPSTLDNYGLVGSEGVEGHKAVSSLISEITVPHKGRSCQELMKCYWRRRSSASVDGNNQGISIWKAMSVDQWQEKTTRQKMQIGIWNSTFASFLESDISCFSYVLESRIYTKIWKSKMIFKNQVPDSLYMCALENISQWWFLHCFTQLNLQIRPKITLVMIRDGGEESCLKEVRKKPERKRWKGGAGVFSMDVCCEWKLWEKSVFGRSETIKSSGFPKIFYQHYNTGRLLRQVPYCSTMVFNSKMVACHTHHRHHHSRALMTMKKTNMQSCYQ